MLNLYFVRHGETEWNVEGRLQGHLDSNLTEKGIQQAKLLGERFVDTEFVAVISSPSSRAIQTTQFMIGERALPLKTDERLMEIHLGKWQGARIEEIKEMDAERYHHYYNQPHLFKNEEGEDFFDVKGRLEQVLKELEASYHSGNLLIVTHGMVINTLLTMCKQKPVDCIWDHSVIEGSSVTIVKVEAGKKQLLVEGDLSHLKDLKIEYNK